MSSTETILYRNPEIPGVHSLTISKELSILEPASTLLSGQKMYPTPCWDLTVISLYDFLQKLILPLYHTNLVMDQAPT